ncbi:YciI family protein [Nocardioides caldifontis]|uniref:YciI family protein n=1 Tax=Nocardioides caldifontis TaxID=2588938 RepID=UPI001EF0A2EE|nr:YciI family protein [Nocardioides caldifontis]
MKFLVLMAEKDSFARWEAADAAEHEAAFARFEAFARAVEERGSMLGGDALASPDQARTLRPADDAGVRSVVAGPYAETVEQLGGFFLIDVADLETALEAARELPESYSVEVRPIIDMEPG